MATDMKGVNTEMLKFGKDDEENAVHPLLPAGSFRPRFPAQNSILRGGSAADSESMFVNLKQELIIMNIMKMSNFW